MKQQTAVQWLIDNLEKYEDYAKISWRCLGEIEIALEMEKQQIIDANSNGWHDGQEIIMNMLKSIDFVGKGGDDNGEQYYNETYGSKGSDGHELDDDIPPTSQYFPTSSQTEISDDRTKLHWKTSLVIHTPEISDEEIEKGAKECFENKGKSIFWDYNTMPSFTEGAKWYREQLKLKLN